MTFPWLAVYHSARHLLRSPGYATSVALTLAMGIAASTTAVAIVDAVLLRPFPVALSERVVSVHRSTSNSVQGGFLYPDFVGLFDRSVELVDAMSGSGSLAVPVAAPDNRPALINFVTVDYFRVAGIRQAVGREFDVADHRAGAELVAILTDAFWRDRLGADPQAIGRTMRVGTRHVVIIGILPPRFRGFDLVAQVDLFMPLMAAPAVGPAMNYFSDSVAVFQGARYSPTPWIRVHARLKHPANTTQQLDALLTAVSSARQDTPSTTRITTVPINVAALPKAARQELVHFTTLLSIIVTLILLVGCLNISMLTVTRNEQRRHEVATRVALGANRTHLLCLLLTDSVVITVAGLFLGLLFTAWTIEGLTTFVLPGGVRLEPLQLRLTLPAVLFAIATATVLSILAGVVPSWQASGGDFTRVVRRGSASITTPQMIRRRLVVIAQVGVSLTLAIGAALFVKSVRTVLAADTGVASHQIGFVTVSFIGTAYAPPQVTRLYETILTRLRDVPDVEVATFGGLPFVMSAGSIREITVNGAQMRLPRNLMVFYCGPNYLRTLGLTLNAGDDSALSGRAVSTTTGLVSRALAEYLWRERTPIGDYVSFKPLNESVLITGVVTNYRVPLGDDTLALYLPWSLNVAPQTAGVIVARSRRNPAHVVPLLERLVHSSDPQAVITSASTLDRYLARVVEPQRISATVLGSLGALAILFSSLGAYSLVAHNVQRRRKEVGIRLALGARRWQVAWLMIHSSVLPIALGIGIGIVGGYIVGRASATLLVGVNATDPDTFTRAVIAVSVAGIAASVLGAYRVIGVDPAQCLREDGAP